MAPDCLRGWVNAVGGDEHSAALFIHHDAIELVPVVVGSTGGEEDRSEQAGDGVRRHIGMRVVGTGEFCGPVYRYPFPAASDGKGDFGAVTQVLEFDGVAERDERDDVVRTAGMENDPGVDDGDERLA